MTFSGAMRAPTTMLMVIALAGCVVLAGCGGATNRRDLGLKNIPLPPGSRVTAVARVCDRGANAYCAEQLVVTGGGRGRYTSSADLLNSENEHLKQLGWSDARGNTGKQLAAQSPGNELRLYFATAYNDLLALDMGWIHRSAPIGRALSAAIFDRAPALSVMLVRASS
jgi:hypothetical protein